MKYLYTKLKIKRLSLSVVICMVLSACAFAVPLGGAGSSTKQSIKGSLELEGILSVDGKVIINGIEYTWPALKDTVSKDTVLKNDGKGNLSWQSEVSPGGQDGAIQIGKDGKFVADKDLYWNFDKKNLSVNGKDVSVLGHTHPFDDISGVLPSAQGGTGTNDGSINATQVRSQGTVQSETGFAVKEQNGANGYFDFISDIKIENNILKTKSRKATVAGGIITDISENTDWTDAGQIDLPDVSHGQQ